MQKLKVHTGKRFLMREDGSPFFYLGDTAWELFHRLTMDEVRTYLDNRKERGFNVVQACALAELDGLRVPNREGELPLSGMNPEKPNEKYFRFIDRTIEEGLKRDMYVGLLPTWGDKWNMGWGAGPVIFTPENAFTYGKFLGERYRDSPVIWIMGGDRRLETETHYSIIRRMAEGLKEGDKGVHLFTLHTIGPHSSSEFVHNEPWLDFNMIQSGHGELDYPNYRMIGKDRGLTPVRPVLDGEPCYEEITVMTYPDWKWDREAGYFNAHQVRKRAYWSLLAGSFGHTYGASPNWMMHGPDQEPYWNVRRTWKEGMELPGAAQVRHAKELLLERSFFTRVPAQDMIVSDNSSRDGHVRVSRDSGGTYALVYFPVPGDVTLDLSGLNGDILETTWMDPKTGRRSMIKKVKKEKNAVFSTPAGPEDAVLIIKGDDK